MAGRFRKADITFHRLGYGSRVTPAVNVKVYRSPGAADWAMLSADAGEDRRFDEAWIAQHLTDRERDTWWTAALEDAWEQLREMVNDPPIFGRTVEVYSEGRSSGWAYVDYPRDYPGRSGPLFEGREAVASWDAVAVARWGKFSSLAKRVADDVPYKYLWNVYHHAYLPWREEEDARLAKAAAEARLSL